MTRILRMALLAPVLFAANPNLANVKSIYVLPMSNGMDQYLANRLRTDQIVSITTDPQAADAILTDMIGPPFERRLQELYPPPPPPPKSEKDEEKEEEEVSRGDIRDSSGADHRTPAYRKGRGMVFLVDRQSRQVIWSTHERPKDASAKELDRTAGRVSERLKKDYGAK